WTAASPPWSSGCPGRHQRAQTYRFSAWSGLALTAPGVASGAGFGDGAACSVPVDCVSAEREPGPAAPGSTALTADSRMPASNPVANMRELIGQSPLTHLLGGDSITALERPPRPAVRRHARTARHSRVRLGAATGGIPSARPKA